MLRPRKSLSLILSLTTSCAAAASRTARADDAPAAPEPTTQPVAAVADLFELVVRDRVLTLSTELPVTESPRIVRVDGLTADASVHMNKVGTGGRIEKFDFNLPREGQVVDRLVTVTATATSLDVTQFSSRDDTEERHNVQLIQHIPPPDQPAAEENAAVTLSIDVNDPASGQPPYRALLQASDFADLRERHPRETTRYLLPVLASIQQEHVFAPDPVIARQVFADQWTSDEPTRRRVDDLVRRLGADRAADRAAAAKELKDLGATGAAALRTIDRGKLSAEQNTQIDALLAPFQPLDRERAVALASDVDFLLDCLYLDEEPLRRAAIARLADVSQRRIEFDFAATGRAKARAVQQVREIFYPAPATRPASTTPATAPDGAANAAPPVAPPAPN